MSWIDNLLGTDSDDQNNSGSLNDKDIALDMLISSKMDISSLAKTITETTNPQLRQLLSAQLTNCINQHFRLSDMAINKQWYNAYANPQQQVQQDVKELQNLSQQNQQDQQSNQSQQ
ncbi:spore coat protein [Clostridium sp. CX1]|uniref:Spore coat protein n=1 Tax=Clostridium tanneri TaxID=3037988 RepID=A0ABU4JRV5_9CLOT|nr:MULTISPECIES: spore coat protein [unclassified Clostridium]MCT8977783.1 spore coat protein [Clostridium sp. CX1]MDW8800862.1 spore coat protein [Clostridium sp. A1-XYC3]